MRRLRKGKNPSLTHRQDSGARALGLSRMTNRPGLPSKATSRRLGSSGRVIEGCGHVGRRQGADALLHRRLEQGRHRGAEQSIEETADLGFTNLGVADPEKARGPQGVRKIFGAFREAFTVGRTTVEDTAAEGDTVVTRCTFRGTNQGEFAGLAPTGRRVEMTGIKIDRVADGKIFECWCQLARLGPMRQSDAAPYTGRSDAAGSSGRV
jgi:predicted ester cyclase